jgi:hypothetical protein
MAFFKIIKKIDLSKCSICKGTLELKVCSLCGKLLCSEHYEKSALGICWCTECIKREKENDYGYLLPMM